MQVLKKILVSIAMAASMAAVSSSAFAAEGDAKVKAAAENAIIKIEEAVSIVEKGGDKAEVIKAINDARQIQKDFRYEVTERQREKANTKLKVARDAFESGDFQPAEAKLREALASYQEMKAIYDSNHK